MEEMVVQLASTALAQQVVARRELDDGKRLFVYPLNDGVVVGLGVSGYASSWLDAEKVIQKRSTNLDRYGTWMPALFADGSYCVLRRVPGADASGAMPIIPEAELSMALELLS